jgi:hypothetical protein
VVNPVIDRIYVANYNDASVTVIDGATNFTDTSSTGFQPIAMGVDLMTNRVYVANYGDDTVSVIDEGFGIITPSAGSNGSISPASPQTVTFGGLAGFTMTPAIGYHVADVLVDGSSVGAVPVYTFGAVAANHTISASFAVNPATHTTIKASAKRIKRGKSLTLSGKVTPVGTVGLPVRIYMKRPKKTAWIAAGTRMLAAGGAWKQSFATKKAFAPGVYSFKAVFAATTAFGGSTSSSVKVTVAK